VRPYLGKKTLSQKKKKKKKRERKKKKGLVEWLKV
jgi:hypothetical protein